MLAIGLAGGGTGDFGGALLLPPLAKSLAADVHGLASGMSPDTSQVNRADVNMPLAMLSIVIPLLNEAESLGTLHAELSAVADAEGYDMEIIFVDDGSTDGSWAGGAAAGGGRSAGARDSLPPQFRQGGGAERRLSARPAAS